MSNSKVNEKKQPNVIESPTKSGIKKTERNALLKLELAGDVHVQLGRVAKVIYNIEAPPHLKSRESVNWSTTDEKLYAVAKNAYDGVLAPFTEEPRVYKFESTKAKVWEANKKAKDDLIFARIDSGQKLDKSAARPKPANTAVKRTRVRARKLGEKLTADEENEKLAAEAKMLPMTEDEQLASYLDPFQVPKPWRTEITKDGRTVYFNDETRDRTEVKPGEIWTDKLELLQKLTPREDLSGYDYKENDQEKRKRMRQQLDFEKKMQIEIRRRMECPTDIEQVEDALFFVVDTICKAHDDEVRLMKSIERKIIQSTWHVVNRGYRMKRLAQNETEDGETVNNVTDMDFVDMIISITGHCLALLMPAGLLEGHEVEREEEQRAATELAQMEERERQMPVKEKAKVIMAIARNDRNAAMERLMKEVKYHAMKIPRRLQSLDRDVVLHKSKDMIVQGLSSLLRISKNPRASVQALSEAVTATFNKYLRKPSDEPDVDIDALLQEFQKAKEVEEKKTSEVVAYVETALDRLNKALKAGVSQPVKHTDCIMVKLVILADPPPHFIKHPPRTWKDDAQDAKNLAQQLKEQSTEFLTDFQFRAKAMALTATTLSAALPPIVKNAITKVTGVDVDTAAGQAQETSKSLLGLAAAEREKVRRNKIKKARNLTRSLSPDVKRKPQRPSIMNHEDQENAVMEHLTEGELNGEETSHFDETKMDTEVVAIAESVNVDENIQAGEQPLEDVAISQQQQYDPEDAATQEDAAHAVDPMMTSPPTELLPLTVESMSLPPSDAHASLEPLGTTGTEFGRLTSFAASLSSSAAQRLNPLLRKLPAIMRPKTEAELIIGENDYAAAIIKPPEVIKDIFDPSLRQEFERRLIEEIASATCLPTKNICIEEIRRLPRNDSKLVALKYRNEQIREIKRQEQEQERIRTTADHDKRRAIIMGKYDEFLEEAENDDETHGMQMSRPTGLFQSEANDFDGLRTGVEVEIVATPRLRDSEILRDSEPELIANQAESLGELPVPPLDGDLTNSDLLILNRVTSEVPMESVVNPEVPFVLEADISNHDNDIGVDIVAAKSLEVQQLHSTSQQDDSSNVAANLAALPIVDSLGLSTDLVTIFKFQPICPLKERENSKADIDEIVEQNETNIEAIVEEIIDIEGTSQVVAFAGEFAEHISLSAPVRPEYFKIGIRNPDDLKNDPSYWLAKGLRQLTEMERREKRIMKLKLTIKETGLKAKLKELQRMRDEMVDDFVSNYVEAARDGMEAVATHPSVLEMRAQVAEKSTVYVNQFMKWREIARASMADAKDRLKKSTREFIAQLNVKKSMPANLAIEDIDQMPLAEDHAICEVQTDIVHPEEIIQLLNEMCAFVADAEQQQQPSPQNSQRSHLSMLIQEEHDDLVSQLAEVQSQQDLLEAQDQVVDSSASEAPAGDGEDSIISAENVKNGNDEVLPPLSEEADVVKEIENDVLGEIDHEIAAPEPEIVVEYNDATFEASRLQYLDSYDVVIVNLLAALSTCIDIALTDGEDIHYVFEEMSNIYDDAKDRTKYQPDGIPAHVRALQADSESIHDVEISNDQPTAGDVFVEDVEEEDEGDIDAVIGCEISLMIHITDEQRALEGLDSIEAEDIGVMLQQQLFEDNSALRLGLLTQHVLDVQYKVAHAQREFKAWEDFWVHIIHPAFYGYSSTKPVKKERHMSAEESEFAASGIQLVNPVSKFSEPSKELFMTLENKNKPIGGKKKLRASVLNLNVDPLAQFDEQVIDGTAGESKKLQLYRPNMQALTSQDVMRLKRLCTVFEENYNKVMTLGLVDGVRLRPDQLLALKNKESAHRIYRTARQKLARSNRDSENTSELPALQITRITEDVFQEWMDEVRDEEAALLKEHRLKSQKAKELRQQENEVKRAAERQKAWMLTQLVALSPDTVLVGRAFTAALETRESERMKALSGSMPIAALQNFRDQQQQLQSIIISEEKNTRRLFKNIFDWKQRTSNKPTAILDQLSSSESSSIVGLMPTIKEGTQADEIGALIGGDAQIAPDNLSLVVSLDSAESALPEVLYIDLITFVNNVKAVVDAEESHNAFTAKKDYIANNLADHIQRNNDFIESKTRKKETGVKGGFNSAVIELVELKLPEFPADHDEQLAQCAVMEAKALAAAEILRSIDPKVLPNAEDIQLVGSLRWVKAIHQHHQFSTCLKEISTMKPGCFARNELVQFATLSVHFEPILSKVISDVKRAQEDAAIAAGLKSKKKSQRDAHNKKVRPIRALSPEKQEAAKLKEGLDSEALARSGRASEAAKRQALREKAWLTAHPHKFIEVPGERAFCIVCKEKVFDAWMEAHMSKEAAFFKHFQDNFNDIAEEHEESLEEQVTKEHEKFKPLYIVKPKLDKRKGNYQEIANAEAKLANESQALKMFEPTAVITRQYDSFVDIFKNYLMKKGRIRNSDEPNVVARRSKVPMSHLRSGLSFVDANGLLIVPEEPEPEVMEQAIVIPTNGEGEDDDEDSGRAPLGIKIRLWHKEDQVRGDFLGQIKMSYDEIFEPAKGMRTFPLEADPSCIRASRAHIPVEGSLTVKVNIAKIDKYSQKPVLWKLEIIRANKIMNIDPLTKSNPCCEVQWRGPTERNKEIKLSSVWVTIGWTNAKERTIDPVFDKTKDGNIFELPPVWTDYPIPGRGVDGVDLLGGGWVARNCIPEPPSEAVMAAASSTNLTDAGSLSSATPEEVLAQQISEMIRLEVQLRLETTKLLWTAQEQERQCMAHEERNMMRHLIDSEVVRCKPYIEEQHHFSKEFSKLVQFILEPPRILARLRFMMGSSLCSGGLRIMCQDPTTNKMLNLISMPILYPEDEVELTTQLNALIGYQHQHLMKILDFSVHQARGFNFNGFPNVNERVALIVLDRYEGPSMLEYMKSKWDAFTNDEFRELLKQLALALQALHAEGIIHRNVYEGMVIVEVPVAPKIVYDEVAAARADAVSKAASNKGKIPNCRLGEYWFLHNPRKVGCPYSQGRADWGARSTMPPEALVGHDIQTASDIYAFGVCVFHWATGGMILPEGITQATLESLRVHIPLKWGVWVQSLLRMCLQHEPKHRASAREIVVFLNSRFGKNQSS